MKSFMQLFKQKKAVSPLIATVLLIAFAVALGAIVMSWGETYVENTADFTESQSDVQLQCSSLVDFKVQNVEFSNNTDGLEGTGINITIENEEAKIVKGFTFVIRDEENKAITVDKSSSKTNTSNDLSAFNSRTYIINSENFEDVGTGRLLKEIKVIPHILPDDDPQFDISPCSGDFETTDYEDSYWPLYRINFTNS